MRCVGDSSMYNTHLKIKTRLPNTFIKENFVELYTQLSNWEKTLNFINKISNAGLWFKTIAKRRIWMKPSKMRIKPK